MPRKKGLKHTEEAKRKISESRLGQKVSEQTKIKMSKVRKGRILVKDIPKWKENMSSVYEKILMEIPELEKQGFKCIPIGRVIPDIIAIKDNEVYAIEVEYRTPNYKKYDRDNYRRHFKDVIWLLRK